MFSSHPVLSTCCQHDLLLLVLTSLAWLRYVCPVSPRRSHSFSPLPLLSSLGVTVCSRVWGGKSSSLPFPRAPCVHELFRMLLHESRLFPLLVHVFDCIHQYGPTETCSACRGAVCSTVAHIVSGLATGHPFPWHLGFRDSRTTVSMWLSPAGSRPSHWRTASQTKSARLGSCCQLSE